MAFQRIKVFRITVCISVIMYTFLLVSFVWLDTARNTDTNSKVPRIRATKVLIDGKVYPIQDSFDCAKLFNGDGDEMKRAISYLRNKTSIQHFYSRFNYMPLNCEKYKLSRDYITKPFLKSEEDFPMAFNIIFHKGFVQLERLLHVIYRPQHQICIHIDRKTSKDIFEQVKVLVDCFDNVFIASKLEVIVYEGFTRLLADINCMKDHVERNFKWKYLINVAASEYPLMSNLEMVQVLREFDGVNDVEEVMTHTNQDRYRKKHFTYIDAKTLSGRMIHTRERKQSPPHGLTITKGNAYGIFSRAFVEFVLKDKIAHDLLLWLEDTSVSEEHYWSTLNNLYNNPFLNTPGGYKGKVLLVQLYRTLCSFFSNQLFHKRICNFKSLPITIRMKRLSFY